MQLHALFTHHCTNRAQQQQQSAACSMGLWSIMKAAPVAVAPVIAEFINKSTAIGPTPPGMTNEQHVQQQLQAKQERIREQKRYQRVRARAREIQLKRAAAQAAVSYALTATLRKC
jgi:hypothetical protein